LNSSLPRLQTSELLFQSLVGLLICSLLLGAMFGYFIASTNAHTQAVKQDCGHYSPKTGEFLWGPLQ
jgi:hypothetical protein